MNKVVLFCVESPKDKPNDWVYIDAAIKHFFDLGKRIAVRPIFMGSKYNYKSTKVLTQINQIKRLNPDGLTIVLCIDTDNYESNPQHAKELEEIKDFCKNNDYELIWFCHDIEEVFLGKRISDNEKTREARRFGHNRMIESVEQSCLSRNKYQKSSSNILCVLNKVFLEDE